MQYTPEGTYIAFPDSIPVLPPGKYPPTIVNLFTIPKDVPAVL